MKGYFITFAILMMIAVIIGVAFVTRPARALAFAWVRERFRFSLRSLILLVALAGSGYGLWARWEPWAQMRHIPVSNEFELPASPSPVEEDGTIFIPNSPVLLGIDNSGTRVHVVLDTSVSSGVVFNPRSGTWVHASDLPRRDRHVIEWGWKSQDGKKTALAEVWSGGSSSGPEEVTYTTADGRSTLAQFTSTMSGKQSPLTIYDVKSSRTIAQLTDRPYRLSHASFSEDGNILVTAEISPSGGFLDWDAIDVWQRRRPEYWWGVAWLPEFWLTVVLSSGLAWSLWRDRKLRPR